MTIKELTPDEYNKVIADKIAELSKLNLEIGDLLVEALLYASRFRPVEAKKKRKKCS